MRMLACQYCRKPTATDEPGSSYAPDAISRDGELEEETVVCAKCMLDLDAWIENQARILSGEA